MIKEEYRRFLPAFVTDIFHVLYNKYFDLYFLVTRGIRKHVYEGCPLNIYIFDQVSKLWYDHDWERGEISYLKVKPGSRIFNIGAHQGVVALVFSKIVGDKGSVVAVEMDKKHTEIAKINKKNNNSHNISIVHAAVAAQRGKVRFAKDQITNNSNRSTYVKSITIDILSKKYGVPDVLYIDVEGYEQNVLKGAKRTLSHTPDCYIEVHVNKGLEVFGGSAEGVIAYFPKSKYKLFMAKPVDNCVFKPFSMESPIVKDRFYLIATSKRQ